MTPHAITILFWGGLTVYWFSAAYSLLRKQNSAKPGYRITGHMAILLGFQTLAFTFIVASNSEWLRFTNDVGWFLLTFVPFTLITAVFVVIRLFGDNNPE
mgnify:FL=1